MRWKEKQVDAGRYSRRFPPWVGPWSPRTTSCTQVPRRYRVRGPSPSWSWRASPGKSWVPGGGGYLPPEHGREWAPVRAPSLVWELGAGVARIMLRGVGNKGPISETEQGHCWLAGPGRQPPIRHCASMLDRGNMISCQIAEQGSYVGNGQSGENRYRTPHPCVHSTQVHTDLKHAFGTGRQLEPISDADPLWTANSPIRSRTLSPEQERHRYRRMQVAPWKPLVKEKNIKKIELR